MHFRLPVEFVPLLDRRAESGERTRSRQIAMYVRDGLRADGLLDAAGREPDCAAIRAERLRCLAWVQHAREEGETDMRQLRAWIESGDQP